MDRRKYPRSEITLSLRVEALGLVYRGNARDMSTRGIYIELQQGKLPEKARDVRLYFEIDTGEQVLSRQINGNVIRNEADGLAVRFAEHDVLGRAVVHEMMYYMQLCRGETLPAAGCTHDSLIHTSDGRAA